MGIYDRDYMKKPRRSSGSSVFSKLTGDWRRYWLIGLVLVAGIAFIWGMDKWREKKATDQMKDRMAEYQQYIEERTVDINLASHDELMEIPFIDSKLADRIIENRPYSSPDDLLKVKGIGNLMLDELRPFMEFGEVGITETEPQQ